MGGRYTLESESGSPLLLNWKGRLNEFVKEHRKVEQHCIYRFVAKPAAAFKILPALFKSAPDPMAVSQKPFVVSTIALKPTAVWLPAVRFKTALPSSAVLAPGQPSARGGLTAITTR